MEVDFSSRIKAFFEAKIKSSESIADSGDLLHKVESILVAKASEHNEKFEDKVTVDQLKKACKQWFVEYESSVASSHAINSMAIYEADMFLDMKREVAIEASYEISDQNLHLNC